MYWSISVKTRFLVPWRVGRVLVKLDQVDRESNERSRIGHGTKALQRVHLLFATPWRKTFHGDIKIDPLKSTRPKGKKETIRPLHPFSQTISQYTLLPTQPTFTKMSPYNTRSAARRRALGIDENAVVSPSATGKGTHTRWTYSDEVAPTLPTPTTREPEASFDRPMTPDQDEDEEFQRSPTTCSVEIPNEPTSHTAEDNRPNTGEQAVVGRMFAQLQEQKKAAEELMMRNRVLADASGSYRSANPKAQAHDLHGPKLPPGVAGFGRNGTWIIDEMWRPEFAPSTDQLPSIHESGEEQEVQGQGLAISEATQEDLGRGAGLRTLTPLPSFVTGDGAARMR